MGDKIGHVTSLCMHTKLEKNVLEHITIVRGWEDWSCDLIMYAHQIREECIRTYHHIFQLV